MCLQGLVYTNKPESATLLGLVKQAHIFTPVTELKARADFK